jgi:hypothetical protein
MCPDDASHRKGQIACDTIMHLSDYDLKQLDDESLGRLSDELVRGLAIKLLADLKEARDRLNRTPDNSSRPPGSQAPWEKVRSGKQQEPTVLLADDLPETRTEPQAQAQAQIEGESSHQHKSNPTPNPTLPKRPGRRPGAPGVSRTQKLPVSGEEIHVPSHCAVCKKTFGADTLSSAYTARYEIDVVVTDSMTGMPGLVLTHTKHIYMESDCECGHRTRAQPGRAEAEEGWSVELSEWHLVGPSLVALICALWRLRLSRARIQEFLHDWLGLELSVATINQCLHEAGRAVEPVVQGEILKTVREAAMVYADETSGFEWGRLLWLWVFTCSTATLYVIGERTKAVVDSVLNEAFEQWLMSDGYQAYRDYFQRVRCLAHIVRKARGLVESLDQRAQGFGSHVLTLLEEVMDAVYQARAAPPEEPLRKYFSERLDNLFRACVHQADSKHEKTRALARELLNDWTTFWLVLDDVWLPLTNNEAERALRNWVIVRRICFGTRTPQGSRVVALLASTIETCRKRSASPWHYIAEVIRQRRNGLPAPALPIVPVA